MAGTSSQFLQVPKVLPHRTKSRSRSRSRPREVVPRPEVVVSPVKSRPQSPPMPHTESYRKPTLNGFTSNHDVDTNPYPNGNPKRFSIGPPRPGMEPIPVVEQEGTNYDDLNGDLYTLEKCLTPPPEPPLQEKLIGTWRLESYTAYPTPYSNIQRPTYPMTKNVTGFIMYTPDGYMSAQFLIPGQQSFKRGEGEEAQWAEAGKRFFAYSGPYYVSNEGPYREEVLRHTFQCCNLPGWIGDIQVRTTRFEENGEVLVLGSEEPTEIKGDKRIPELKWRRARSNANGVPPPPTPQIKISGPGEL